MIGRLHRLDGDARRGCIYVSVDNAPHHARAHTNKQTNTHTHTYTEQCFVFPVLVTIFLDTETCFTNYHVRFTLAEDGNGIRNTFFISRAELGNCSTEKRITLEITKGN